ncbi:NAD-dependent epimerase/dehydratase family protein [Devosia sp. SD17-2]|uniref:NAD-dependent epimerase/dehydratase family protein n=1 Tax=Devosia sp. SD17-2 TaxID=2976459 RepID=UPI0023D7DDCF|nr:NAD-dependent epimerase/dehydratase family protein [Devosia sp. SD17-2]WEJ32947.1 NAD-dependent epimerase/dehydratase family protein [Devosia sp. SD17-2]
MISIPDFAGRHIAVAGGAGFIGRHMCNRLLDGGATVLCIDNFLTSAREDLAPLLARPGFSLLEADIVAPLDFVADGIINLACPASPVAYQRDAVETMRINVIGTDRLLAMARKLGVRFLQASTSEVYGDPEVHPQPETYLGHVNPIGPRSCYDEGKRAAETLCTDYARQHGVDVRIARIFNTYGPGMAADDGRIISNFVTQALRDLPLSIYGDGTQTRSLCYVADTVEGLLRLFFLPDVDVLPINIGSTDELSVAEIALSILEATGSRSPLSYHPLPVDDPRQRRPDTARAAKVLGWRPQTSLRAGLAHTIAHFAERLEARASHPEPAQ